MYQDWAANLVVVTGTMAAVAACVLLHYEGLLIASKRLPSLRVHQRAKVVWAIAAVLVLHVIQIWIFGLAMWFLLLWPGAGSLGSAPLHLFDFIYFSAGMFTTVGFGDLAPSGPIRFLSGVEALTGFVLIAWSASFVSGDGALLAGRMSV